MPVMSLLCLVLSNPGCSTDSAYTPAVPKPEGVPYTEVRLREGDGIKISFPGAPALDTTQQVRRDGKIVIALGRAGDASGGEVTALGKTPAELEAEILRLYGRELAEKQVVVTLTSASYPVFVTGAVLRPGKILVERPISVMEAVMEAGGFDYAKANLKEVTVMRQSNGKVTNYKVNVKEALRGNRSVPFYLRPSDIVYVPERFSWF